MHQLSVRPLEAGDIEQIIHYWLQSPPAYLQGMGVDLAKMPAKEEWQTMLTHQLSLPLREKQTYCLIWQLDGKPVGHSNINKISFGKEAYMHLHIWQPAVRKMGLGTSFIKMGLPLFFEAYELERLYCEPYALNAAPNKTLAKAGFRLLKEYTTIPGAINFEQPVCLWEIKRSELKEMKEEK